MPLNHTSEYSELTPKQFEAIGRVMVEWSNIEFLLGVLLSRLLFTPEFLGRVYADEIMASRRQNAVTKALQIHKFRYGNRVVSETDSDEIEDVNKAIEALRGKRNRFSHFCWCRSSDDQIFGTGFSGYTSGSKQFGKDSMIVTMGDLDALYRSSFDIVDRLSKLIQRIPAIDEERNLAPIPGN